MLTTLSMVSIIWLFLTSVVVGRSSFSPARPPAIPLAVRSPFLSTWLNAGSLDGNGGYLAGQWPVHWTQRTTGWAGMIRVDGQTYQWMGNSAGGLNSSKPVLGVDQVSLEYTSTKSIFTMYVNNQVEMNVTFLSPVTPTDYKRQSLPMSYMEVSVKSIDGKSHAVQLYTDVSAEWVSGERGDIAQWDTVVSGDLAYHEIWRQTQSEFDEDSNDNGNGMARWGTVYYSTDYVQGVTLQTGADHDVRNAFIDDGNLTGSLDSHYRAIWDNWPVFAYARDFGMLGSQAQTQLFSIGLLQQNAVQFLGANGLVSLPSLWQSYFSSEVEAVKFFQKDFGSQQRLAWDVDTQVTSASTQVAGPNYDIITSLSVRQVFGALELVGTSDKMYMFMKEISSNGNMQTVDVIFPMHPAMLFFNPDLIKLLLDPLYENQESGHYPNAYSMHDLGTHFPNATGHPDGSDEEMPVEECGNMIIMTLAYAQKSGDTGYLKQHVKIMDQWTQYLLNDTLIPAEQLSTDDFVGKLDNQTNLALKGIIGIRAMGEIYNLLGEEAQAQKYNQIAADYISKWQQYGTAHDANPPHATLSYGANETHGLLYNLWCDLELGLNLVPQSVYDMQSAFYPSVRNEYGVQLDTRTDSTKSDWEMFTAAYCSVETRDLFIQDLANWINTTTTGRPMTDLYDTISGSYGKALFTARPVVGGHFALLVANAQTKKASNGTCGTCHT